MGPDIRLPMGAMFALLGAILTIFGAVSDRDIYGVSLGININLYWGAVILAFGLLMLLLAWRARGKSPLTSTRTSENAQKPGAPS